MTEECELIPVSDKELAAIIRSSADDGTHTDISFGAGGCALKWVKGEPMPAAVRKLGMMRGVLNENMDGAGI